MDKKNNELLVSAWESISKREFGKAKQKLNSTECLNHYKHRKIFLEAIIDYYQGEYDQSLSKLMSIEQTEYLSDPFLLSLYEYKGYSLTLLRRYSEAIEAYSLSIEGKDEITTDHFVIYQHRGICYHQLKNYEKAISDFDKSINLKPDANSYYNKALSLIAINQLQSALECLNRAIELNNDDIKFYCKRMELHSQMKNWDKIIKDANVLLSLKKYADTAYYHRGLAKCHKGDTEDGLKDLSLVEDEELIIRAHQIIEKLKS